MFNKIKDKLRRIIFGLLPKKKYIIFESLPDLSDNTKAVFDEMIKRGLNKKYKFIWWVTDKNKEFPKYENTIYIDTKHKKEYNKYLNRAKTLICCNQFLPSHIKGQTSFYLTHGTALKKLGGYQIPSKINYNLIASEETKELMSQAFNADINTFHGLGFPRNDDLTNYKYDIHKLFKGEYKKIIVWYPTFRQHKNGLTTATTGTIPILDDYKKAIKLNDIAKQEEILIVIKPHFAQDISYITKYELSNIIFITDEFFVNNKINSYQFVGKCDALITDYSSIYFDYLLCDKPIAAVWEDIEEYRIKPGFCTDIDYYMQGAEKVYTLEDLLNFIKNISKNVDNLKIERNKICEETNYSKDGKNTKRVVDFIIEKAKL